MLFGRPKAKRKIAYVRIRRIRTKIRRFFFFKSLLKYDY